MKKAHLVLWLILLISSCSKNGINSLVLESEETMIETKSTSFVYETQSVNHNISIDFAKEILEEKFRGKRITKLDVVKQNGLNLLYIANFDDGWSIVAGDDRVENKVMAYSYEGEFDLNKIDNPEILYWLEMMKSTVECMMSSGDMESAESDLSRNGLSDVDYSQDYYWVDWKLDADTLCVEHNIDHLLKTKWGQSSPWYRKCPVTSQGDTCPVGCVAVAAAQTLYYLKTEKSFPIDVYYHTGITSHLLSNGKYSIDISRNNNVYPSSWWSEMAKNRYQDNTMNVAEFLVDVGDYLEMEYSPSSSSASTSDCPDVFEQYYNTYCDIEDYSSNSYAHLKTSLLRGLPVIVRGASSTAGHSWVIDGCRYTSRQIDQPYQWRMVATDSLNYYYANRQIRYYYTESQMSVIHPDVVEGDEFHEYSSISDVNKYLRMNWGWNGLNDSGYYSFFPTDNSVYNDWLYQNNPKIVYNFRY